MVDAFTSIKTTSGWADQGAAALAYDLLFRWNLRIYPCFRDFVSVRPADVTSQAKAYRLFLNADFAESTVTTALTPLDEETDVSAVKLPTPTYVDLTPTEYGFGTLRTLKLKNRALVPIDPILANAVAFHQVRTVDRLVRAELDAVATQVYMDQAGATNTAVNDLVAGDVLTAQAVRQAHTKLVNAGSQPRDGQFYAAIIHPHTELSLRTESGSGGWRVPNEYGSSQTKLWTGEFGEFEGFRFVSNARAYRTANSGPVDVYKTYFLGHEALAEAVNVEPHIEVGPVIDRLNRFRPLGWYGDMDFSTFRTDSIVVANSTLTAADATALA